MLYNVFLFLHVVFCLAIIILILMQYGKGAEAGASFNTASQTFFGSKGNKSFLVKLTTFLVILFFINCFIIGLLNHKFQKTSIIKMLDKEKAEKIIEDRQENFDKSFEDIPIEKIKNK